MSTSPLASNPAVLRRWSALSSEILGVDSQLPTDWAQFAATNLTAAQAIESRDPQLVALLTGNAPAGLLADALSGNFPDTPPAAIDSATAAKQHAAELVEQLGNPWATGSHSVTGQMQVMAVDPQLAVRLQKEAGVVTQADRDAAEQQRQAALQQALIDGQRRQMAQAYAASGRF